MIEPRHRRVCPPRVSRGAWPLSCCLALLLSATLLAPVVPAQVGLGVRGDREATWPAPTAEDWSKPVLITWQRTWGDAEDTSLETGRPILICINMDGEVASEFYAGKAYRQPEIAELFAPYVCVVASVYRHTPRDWDDQGRRIPCPRFGGVTCGEHIALEQFVFEHFMDGRRIAPRHIMVELDGTESFDVLLAWDTASVFEKVRAGIADRHLPMRLEQLGDRSLSERVASPDVRDKAEIESEYMHGGRTIQRSILDAAVAQGSNASLDVLRLALYGTDVDLAHVARGALLQSTRPEAADLIVKALESPMTPVERAALLAALDRLGQSSPRVATLAVVQRGLSDVHGAIDVQDWTGAVTGGASYAPRVDRAFMERNLSAQEDVLDGQDADAHLALAESFLEQAYDQSRTDRHFAELLFRDALDTARKAEALGATGWRVDAAIAIASYYLDDKPTAWARAEAATKSGEVDDAPGWNAMAVLAIFAQGRQEAITKAVKAGTDWPAEWLADVDAAYAVLARHPFGTDAQVVAHYDFLNWLGAGHASGRVLAEGLDRFSSSADLHARLRTRILWRFGVDRLEPYYDDLLSRPDASADLHWFAGLASMEAAELYRKEPSPGEARDSYGRALAHFDADLAAHPDERRDERDATAAQVALAHGGLARLALEDGDLDDAVEELETSFEASPGTAATQDGLNITPADTARMLRARLLTAGRTELLARLDAALATLDPALLELPAYEKIVTPERSDGEGTPGAR